MSSNGCGLGNATCFGAAIRHQVIVNFYFLSWHKRIIRSKTLTPRCFPIAIKEKCCKFYRKTPERRFSTKVAGLQPAALLENDSSADGVTVNFQNFLK